MGGGETGALHGAPGFFGRMEVALWYRWCFRLFLGQEMNVLFVLFIVARQSCVLKIFLTEIMT